MLLPFLSILLVSHFLVMVFFVEKDWIAPFVDFVVLIISHREKNVKSFFDKTLAVGPNLCYNAVN